MLQLICSYLFYPFALVMGVETADCRRVGTLLGVKTFLNEFVAYDQLSKLIKNKVLMTEHMSLNGTFDYLGRDIVLNSFNGTADSLTLISGVITVRFTDIYIVWSQRRFANLTFPNSCSQTNRDFMFSNNYASSPSIKCSRANVWELVNRLPGAMCAYIFNFA